MSAREFVHKNAYNRGQPNLPSLQFSEWVKLHYNVSIHEETARRWLHRLGFNHKNHLKVFISMDMNAKMFKVDRNLYVHCWIWIV